MEDPISLKQTYDMCCPCPPSGTSEEYFPSVTIEVSADEDPGIPEFGEITFKFRRTERTEKDKKACVRYDLDLKELVNFVAAKKGKEESGDEALERLAKEKAYKEDED